MGTSNNNIINARSLYIPLIRQSPPQDPTLPLARHIHCFTRVTIVYGSLRIKYLFCGFKKSSHTIAATEN